MSTLLLSDHGILRFQFSPKATTSPLSRPIPYQICASPFFKAHLKKTVFSFDWGSIPVVHQLPRLNFFIRGSAQATKEHFHELFDQYTWDQLDKLVSRNQAAAFMQEQYLHIASRLVWSNNFSLASKLIGKNFVIKDLIFVKDNKVCLKDPNTFSTRFAHAKNTSLDKQRAFLQAQLNNSPPVSKDRNRAKNSLAKLARISKKWVSFGKVLYLDILEYKGKKLQDPFSIQSALGRYWADTFSEHPIDSVLAEEYLGKFAHNFHFDEAPPTTAASISRYIAKTHKAMTGPNGVPYSVYEIAGPLAAGVLARTFIYIYIYI